MKIILQNFKCFSNGIYTINFNKDSYLFFLEGKNGSGKSTLLEAIVWCLSDNNLRGNFIKPFKNHSVKNNLKKFKEKEKKESSITSFSHTAVEIIFDDFSIKRTLTGNNTSLILMIKTENSNKIKIYKDPDYIKIFLNKYFPNDLTWYLRQSFPNVFLNSTNIEKYNLLFKDGETDNENKFSSSLFLEFLKKLLKEKKTEYDKKNYLKETIKENEKKIFSSASLSLSSNLSELDISSIDINKLYRKKMRTHPYFKKPYNEIKEEYKLYSRYYKDWIDINKYKDIPFENLSLKDVEKYDEIYKEIGPVKYSKEDCLETFNEITHSFYKKNLKECPKCNEKILFSDEMKFIERYVRKNKEDKEKRNNFFKRNIIGGFEKIYKTILKFDVDENKIKNLSIENLKSLYLSYNRVKENCKDIDFELIRGLEKQIEEYIEDGDGDENKKHSDISIEDVLNFRYNKKLKENSKIDSELNMLNDTIKDLEDLYKITLEINSEIIKDTLQAFENSINYYLSRFECDFKVILKVETKKNFNSIYIEFRKGDEMSDRGEQSEQSELSDQRERSERSEPSDKRKRSEENFSSSSFSSLTFDNIKYLSGGEYSKLNIALTLAFERSRIIILDETLNAVDESFKEKILNILKEETKGNSQLRYVLFVSHSNINAGLYDEKIDFN